MSNPAWYKPEPYDLSHYTRRYMAKTSKDLATINEEGPYAIVAVAGFSHGTAIAIGADLVAMGFVGWHHLGRGRYAPGDYPDDGAD